MILNAAMSLDGKIATRTKESRLSSRRDLRRVHKLRSEMDGIMVGLGTVLADNPKLTVKYFKSKKPSRIIVDSRAETPLDSYVVKTAKNTPTIIAVTSHAPRSRVLRLEKTGVVVLACGKGPLVSLPVLMRRIRGLGIRKLL
ncbi:MAG TPA: dihydrofolate reductase family protein, partial [Candidatus Binatus sp.]|nr:dihydrofolate reductase family protein [Candidatus Binatus sp.]